MRLISSNIICSFFYLELFLSGSSYFAISNERQKRQPSPFKNLFLCITIPSTKHLHLFPHIVLLQLTYKRKITIAQNLKNIR